MLGASTYLYRNYCRRGRRWRRRRGRSTPSVLLPASKTRRRGSVFDSKTRDSFGMKWRPINRESMLDEDERARWTGYPGLIKKVIYRPWIAVDSKWKRNFRGGNEKVLGELELRGECVLNIIGIRYKVKWTIVAHISDSNPFKYSSIIFRILLKSKNIWCRNIYITKIFRMELKESHSLGYNQSECMPHISLRIKSKFVNQSFSLA